MYRVTAIGLTPVLAICAAGAMLAQTGAPIAPPDRALVIVRVPADAIVRIDGQPTNQKGPERRFVTPALEPGAVYTFQIVAHWSERGEEQSAKRTVDFKGGQVTTVCASGNGFCLHVWDLQTLRRQLSKMGRLCERRCGGRYRG